MTNIAITKYIFRISILATFIFFSSGCFDDLNTVPLDDDIFTADKAFLDSDNYKKVLAKLYAGLAVSGQQGPAGQSDISGIDEGFGQYLRGYWYHQELTTDEALIAWNDQTIKDFQTHTWGSSDGFTFAFYSRIFYQISVCNEFLRETTDEKMNDREESDAVKEEVRGFRAEARFLRSLSYTHALDLFRNVPFVTEENKVGSISPEQIQGEDLFFYIENELKEIENEITPIGQAEYGRADQGAVWTLLAKLYLNAEVYAGTERYDECLEYSEKVINSNAYSLDPDYQNMFLADNHLSEEIIFPITFDGQNTMTWGGTTFIIAAGIGGSMDPDDSGMNGGWGGTRTTKEFVAKFPEGSGGYVVEANEGQTADFPKVYVIGDFQDWDVDDTKNSLASYSSDKVFEGYKYFPTDNSEFIIARYPGGGQPFGDNGMDGSLNIGGSNIVAGAAGMYFIKADFNTNTYILERTEWGIIGDAALGWENDVQMDWDAENEAYFINLDLEIGEIKFRANSEWTYNLGDDGMDGILNYEAANLSIVEGGNYDIFFYIDQPDYTYSLKNNSTDSRGFFYKEGQSLEILDPSLFTDGYAINKFKNVDRNGNPGSNKEHCDTDFPLFRLADLYLMASEAILRGNGNINEAVDYYNAVRRRAFRGSSAGFITSGELDLENIIDERGREFYWECSRRTDLVRFGLLTGGDYIWEWKGGVKDGQATETYRDIFPIPSSDLNANTNLVQNPGY